MSRYYFDSSAIVKRYVTEAGSDWVRRCLASPASLSVVIAEITLVEVVSALSRQERGRSISEAEFRRYESLFLSDLADHEITPLDRSTATAAMRYCHRFGLKAYDAVQLGTALAVQDRLRSRGLPPLTFVSSDQDLLAAAATPEFDLHPIDPASLS